MASGIGDSGAPLSRFVFSDAGSPSPEIVAQCRLVRGWQAAQSPPRTKLGL